MADQTLDTAGSGGHTTFASALAAITLPSDIIYVKSTSAEAPTANQAYTNTVGTPAEPTRVISVNNFTDYTPTPGGGFAITAAIVLTFNGNYLLNGIVHNYTGSQTASGMQVGSTVSAGTFQSENCTLGSACTASSNNKPLKLGPVAGNSANKTYRTEHTNLTARFGHVVASIISGVGNHFISNLSIVGVTPNALISSSVSAGLTNFRITDSDLSSWAIGGILDAASSGQTKVFLNNVKLHTSTGLIYGVMSQHNEITAVNCSSGDTSIAFAYYSYAGSVLTDSTVKASSAPLTDGVTEFSRKFTPASTCRRGTPLTTDLILAVDDNESIQPWIDVLIGADGASALDNSQLWIDVSACTVDGATTGTVTSTRAVILATPTAHANSNTPYNDSYSTPMTHTVQIPSAITVRQTGYVKITVNLAYTTNPVYLGKYGR